MPTKSNPTIRTYNRIAREYAERWKDRSAISHHLDRFVHLIKGQGLRSLPVIDIGCGPGFDAAALGKEGLKGIGLDLSWGMLKTASSTYSSNYLLADMLRLPLPGAVGGLWCCASLLHLPRKSMPKALEEFARVLVPNGVLYLSVKQGTGEKWTTATVGESGPRLFTLWDPTTLDRLIEEAGFQIVHSSAETSSMDTVWIARFAIRSS